MYCVYFEGEKMLQKQYVPTKKPRLILHNQAFFRLTNCASRKLKEFKAAKIRNKVLGIRNIKEMQMKYRKRKRSNVCIDKHFAKFWRVIKTSYTLYFLLWQSAFQTKWMYTLSIVLIQTLSAELLFFSL